MRTNFIYLEYRLCLISTNFDWFLRTAGMYMDTSRLASKLLSNISARMYIRFLFGDAISQPTMYAHSSSYLC